MLTGAQAFNNILEEWKIVASFKRLCIDMDMSDLMDIMNIYAKQLELVKDANPYPRKWSEFTYLGNNKETYTSISGPVYMGTPIITSLVSSLPQYTYLINYTGEVLEVSIIHKEVVVINASMNKVSCKFYQKNDDQHLNILLARCLKRIVVSDSFPLSTQCINVINLVEEKRWAAMC